MKDEGGEHHRVGGMATGIKRQTDASNPGRHAQTSELTIAPAVSSAAPAPAAWGAPSEAPAATPTIRAVATWP